MIRTTTRQSGLVALGATIAIAMTTMASAAVAQPMEVLIVGVMFPVSAAVGERPLHS